MTLLEVQTRVARAIFAPVTSSDRIIPAADTDCIKPNDRLTSLERLETYGRSYWLPVPNSLYDDFPGLRAVVGERALHRLLRAYIAESLAIIHAAQPGFKTGGLVATQSAVRTKRYMPALDMVRLEWAYRSVRQRSRENARTVGSAGTRCRISRGSAAVYPATRFAISGGRSMNSSEPRI
jgi:hypothetical protein